ncbi:MAG: class I poly(R)-hydroxyalkanoic acid synthase, partial [Bradyrhizobium guangdongense]
MSTVTTDKPTETKFDAEAFAMNVARAMENGGKALAAILQPREGATVQDRPPPELTEMVKTFTAVAEYWLSDNARASELQTRLAKDYLDLWGTAARRMAGEQVAPTIDASPRDKRFADPEWKSNQFFDFMKQLYLLTTKRAHELVQDADGLDPHTRRKAEFYMQQVTNALSPSNFVLTNPEVLRETVASSGDNLARGLKMLAEDIAAGKGTLKIRQSNPDN